MIDLHSHILPGIDDGPQSLEGSFEMARTAVAAGIETIAATPHINHSYPVVPEQIPAAVAALNEAFEREGIPLAVVPGAEIAVTRLVELAPGALTALRLGDGPSLLIESPLASATNNFDELLVGLLEDGHRVLLAHPERSAFFHRDLARLERIVEAGVLTSITAGSLAGRFGEVVRRFSVTLLAAGLVHDVASDAHDAGNRAPELLAGFERSEEDLPGIGAQADWYTRLAPAAILTGDPLPERPEPPRRRRSGVLGRLRRR